MFSKMNDSSLYFVNQTMPDGVFINYPFAVNFPNFPAFPKFPVVDALSISAAFLQGFTWSLIWKILVVALLLANLKNLPFVWLVS